MSVPSAQPRTQVTPVLHCTVFTSLIRENYSTLRQTRAKIARIVTLFLLHADIAGGIQKVSQQSTTEIETNKSWQGEKIVKFLQHKLLTLICLTINWKREV